MAKLGLSSPWVIFYHEIDAFFKKDPEVRVIYDEELNVVNLYVDNSAKADALTELLENEMDFGSVKLQINVIPANTPCASKGNVYLDAFDGNKSFSYVHTIQGIFSNPLTYVVFKNEVVQYFNDSLNDVNGLCSTLNQDIAYHIFKEKPGVFYCTDVPDKTAKSFGAPLGEWP